MAAVTICSDFGVQENKVCHYFHCFPIYLPWSDGTGCHDIRFWMLSFKPAFSLSFFIFIKRLLSSSSLSGKPIKPPKQCKIWSVYSDVQFPEEKIDSFQMILKREYCLFKKLRGQISSAFLRKTEHSVKSFKKYF